MGMNSGPRLLPLVTEVQRVTHVLGLRLEQALGGLDLGQAEAHVLSLLADAGQATVAELQSGVRHRTSTLTGIVDRLEAKGLAVRRINPADRRSFLIVLTDAGGEAAQSTVAAMAGIEAEARAAHTPSELSAFRRVLASLGGDSVEDPQLHHRRRGGGRHR
jgi:DNA-binding MarR family transcriptional regulator